MFPALNLSPVVETAIRAVLCLLCIPFLRRAFLLPQVPQKQEEVHEKPLACSVTFAAHYGFAREIGIMELLCQGASSEEITKTLGIKESTLRPYISRMFKKTEASSRKELVQQAASFQAYSTAASSG